MAKTSRAEMAARRKVASDATYEAFALLETLHRTTLEGEDLRLLHESLLRRLRTLNSIQMDVMCGSDDGFGSESAESLRAWFEGEVPA